MIGGNKPIELVRVLIGVQARSTSKRFPKKVFAKICGKAIIDHVADACYDAVRYMNKFSYRTNIECKYLVLIPDDDELLKKHLRKGTFFTGPEDDVLSRYKMVANEEGPDYIVRITADCPMIPSYLITSLIKIAVMNGYDYVSNVDDRSRTYADGFDVEVMSARALEWAFFNATGSQREHVTSILRTNLVPKDFRRGHVAGYIFQPNLKLSVDTEEDLERVKTNMESIEAAIQAGLRAYGSRVSVHRI